MHTHTYNYDRGISDVPVGGEACLRPRDASVHGQQYAAPRAVVQDVPIAAHLAGRRPAAPGEDGVRVVGGNVQGRDGLAPDGLVVGDRNPRRALLGVVSEAWCVGGEEGGEEEGEHRVEKVGRRGGDPGSAHSSSISVYNSLSNPSPRTCFSPALPFLCGARSRVRQTPPLADPTR